MKKSILESRLSSTPAPIRKSLLEAHDSLPAGAATVIDRFFVIAASRGEPLDAPSASSFHYACASESTFRLLLRVLAAHAPQVSTAAALSVKADWVSKRPKGSAARNTTANRRPHVEFDITHWPASWQVFLVGLRSANITPKTLKRYVASISRCADVVYENGLSDDLSFLTGYEIAKVLSAQEKRLSPITIANYLNALGMLGRHGGADPAGLTGLAFVSQNQLCLAKGQEKKKFSRIDGLMARGAYTHIARVIAQLREVAAHAPGHSFERTKALQSAAICVVALNMPARTGDMSRWVIGKELTRSITGEWSLNWSQEKTKKSTGAGKLWQEVAESLDEHILGGRPQRLAYLRYNECIGTNWLSLTNKAYQSRWPSLRFKEAVGVPLHDLRTLLADHVRWHSPETAANVIQTMLGHSSTGSGEAYRSDCEQDYASHAWAKIRKEVGKC